MIRAFVALDLPPAVKATLADLQAGVAGARWTDPADLHLTLRFVGEVPEDRLEEVHLALDEIRAPAFDLTLEGVGQFGQGARSRLLWAGVAASPALAHLQAKVESAVVRAGEPAETRRFTPHVTLARLDRQAHPDRLRRFVEGNALLRAGPMPVDRFVLFESRPGSGRPRYLPLQDYPLLG
ncbi:MAG: RNA 2',3'-cyclic phosphodiesterase [Rhodospirillales bacterium]|jgi:2'-5' RNA ligase